jgi:tripartite-type tricarboxylate transporter receptor subunit TctC
VKRVLALFAVIAALAIIPGTSFGAAPFYEGKTIRIIVGMSPGGGFDNYARILSRHMGKYIPGKPAIIVENMTGAGTLIAANYTYKAVKPDGLTICHINGGLLFGQLLGQPGIEFDAMKFNYLGTLSKENGVLWVTKGSGVTSMDQWMASKNQLKLGGTGIGAFMPDGVIRILKTAIGLPAQLVTPYKGGADVRMAAESGELAGSVLAYDAMISTWGKKFAAGDASIILQTVPKPLKGIEKVPLAISYAKTDEARQLIEVGIHRNDEFSRPFLITPGVPKDRVETLQKAFLATAQDKDFIEECAKAKLSVDETSGDELKASVESTFKTPPALLAKLKDILYK